MSKSLILALSLILFSSSARAEQDRQVIYVPPYKNIPLDIPLGGECRPSFFPPPVGGGGGKLPDWDQIRLACENPATPKRCPNCPAQGLPYVPSCIQMYPGSGFICNSYAWLTQLECQIAQSQGIAIDCMQIAIKPPDKKDGHIFNITVEPSKKNPGMLSYCFSDNAMGVGTIQDYGYGESCKPNGRLCWEQPGTLPPYPAPPPDPAKLAEIGNKLRWAIHCLGGDVGGQCFCAVVTGGDINGGHTCPPWCGDPKARAAIKACTGIDIARCEQTSAGCKVVLNKPPDLRPPPPAEEEEEDEMMCLPKHDTKGAF